MNNLRHHIAALLVVVSLPVVAWAGKQAVEELTGNLPSHSEPTEAEQRYENWQGYSPVPALLIVAVAAGAAWFVYARRKPQTAAPPVLEETLTLDAMSTDEAAAREIPEHENVGQN